MTGLDPLAGPGETGQQSPSAFMMTSCWGGEADSGGMAIIQQEKMAEWPCTMSLSSELPACWACVLLHLEGFVDVLRPGLPWMGLPKREEAIGPWCLQRPEVLDTGKSLRSQSLRSRNDIMYKFLFKLTQGFGDSLRFPPGLAQMDLVGAPPQWPVWSVIRHMGQLWRGGGHTA